jgi:hydroxymethylglutaryl-CoA synthase
MQGILRYGSYVPRGRLARSDIAAALDSPPVPGSRSVAGYDEDTTSLGVEAARHIVTHDAPKPTTLHFATTLPAYSDKTNATAIHAALGLPSECFAVDMAGAVRGGVGALRAAAASGGLAVLSDLRVGLPGSADERSGGDGAAAFLFGDAQDALAEVIAVASNTTEFLDRWRVPGEMNSHVWEERFGQRMYASLTADVVKRALSAAGVQRPDFVAVSSPHARAARDAASMFAHESVVEGFDEVVGYCGAAHAGLLLADALDRAQPGQTVLVVVASDGCDALVLRTTEALVARRQPTPVRAQMADGRRVSYGSYLTWRGLLRREPPRRPDPSVPAPPASARRRPWKFSLVGSRCRRCGTAHLPPARVCASCRATDDMEAERFAERPGRVATYTVDHLAWSMAPPVIVAVVDFDGGGRLVCELTDADPTTIGIGTRVEMTFRRVYTADSVHNYFWKARPVEVK